MSPVIDVPKLTVKAPKDLTTMCDPLQEYKSTDVREVITTVVQNNNIYYMCASKMKAASNYIKQSESVEP